jgi:hypothetical protein
MTFEFRDAPIHFHQFHGLGVAAQDVRDRFSLAWGDSALCNGCGDVLKLDVQILRADDGP